MFDVVSRVDFHGFSDHKPMRWHLQVIAVKAAARLPDELSAYRNRTRTLFYQSPVAECSRRLSTSGMSRDRRTENETRLAA